MLLQQPSTADYKGNQKDDLVVPALATHILPSAFVQVSLRAAPRGAQTRPHCWWCKGRCGDWSPRPALAHSAGHITERC